MVSTVRNLLCLTILAVLVSSGYAIRCYNCHKILSSKGGHNLKESELIDCSSVVPNLRSSQDFQVPNATGCLKLSLETRFFEAPIHQVIVRSCYFGHVSNKKDCTADLNILEAKVLACEVCTEDGCNGSG